MAAPYAQLDVELYKRELAELVADECAADEIITALVRRHGRLQLRLVARMLEQELDEQARRDEWTT
jgi:hypothetical protein